MYFFEYLVDADWGCKWNIFDVLGQFSMDKVSVVLPLLGLNLKLGLDKEELQDRYQILVLDIIRSMFQFYQIDGSSNQFIPNSGVSQSNSQSRSTGCQYQVYY